MFRANRAGPDGGFPPSISVCRFFVLFLIILERWPKFKFQGESSPDRKNHIVGILVDPYRRPERIYGVFIPLACLFQKLLKTCWAVGELLRPDVTLGISGGVTGRNFSIQGVKFACNPMFGSIYNGLSTKETPFIVLPLI